MVLYSSPIGQENSHKMSQNIIVILGNSSPLEARERTYKGIELAKYLDGQCEVIVSREGRMDVEGSIMPESHYMASICHQEKIPVLIEDKSRNTTENIVNSKQMIEGRYGECRWYIVTSEYHMQRSVYIANQYLPNVYPYAAPIPVSSHVHQKEERLLREAREAFEGTATA